MVEKLERQKKGSHLRKGGPLAAGDDVCLGPLSIRQAYQPVLTLQKQLPLMTVAISPILSDAGGNNKASLRCVIFGTFYF